MFENNYKISTKTLSTAGYVTKIPFNELSKKIDFKDKNAINLKIKASLIVNNKKITENYEYFILLKQNIKEQERSEKVKIFTKWKKAKKYVKNGGKAIIIMGEKENILCSQKKKKWNYRTILKTVSDILLGRKKIRELKITIIPHHKGENWIGMFSTHIFNSSLISPIELNEKTLWALGDACPSNKLIVKKEFSEYKILSGFIQGWYNRLYPTTIILRYGKGKILITTIPLLKKNEKDILRIIYSNILKYF